MCAQAVKMGEGPDVTRIAEVKRTFNEFYLEDKGEPVNRYAVVPRLEWFGYPLRVAFFRRMNL